MRKASTDASQNINLEEEVSIETNPIEEPEHRTDTDLSEKDREKKKADKLSEIYKSRVPFHSDLEVGSSTLESPPPELKSSLITSNELSDTLSVSIASNSTSNLKTQFMSILEEQIGEILDKQRSMNGFVNYLSKIKNEDVKYFLKIGNKILKFIIGHLPEIGNPKLFINPKFDTG